jgi:DNA-binding NarL/FixJ family response regulator
MSTPQKIRVLCVGYRPPEVQAFEGFLQQQPEIAMVGACNDLDKIPHVAWQCVPHVMLIYLKGTQLAINVIRHVLTEVPDARMLVIAIGYPANQAVEIIESGAWGVLTFDELGKQGLRAIRAIRDGEIWGSRKVLSRIVHTTARHTSRQITQSKAMQSLTGREGEIVKLLQEGSSNKEIAAQLAISDNTVKVHLHNIYTKLKINRRHKILPKLFS